MNEKEFILMTSSKDYVGEYIRFYRERADLTQKKLAKLIKKTANSICDYETNKRVPSEETFIKIYEAINKIY
ncbi:helix-turn-helix domain-containing protein [Clostridium gasigenes]|uniref:Helix-turn-helix domain-containing protein n=1 Tax=Clostridium gasigenes TaxID=94869 RepID=A0A1H0M665_9CLOT|nr:helix-turn-helix transcriptional regulator [Clostridium gasigenes]SDO75923.1 Helix-turn-helix domain-containing protein [Clostridium gasigenes]